MADSTRLVRGGLIFEWDSAKAGVNLSKHGVSFEFACEAFFDPFVKLVAAPGSEEPRDAIIGYTESQSLLFVVHVIRHEETIRIISARRATPTERRIYEDY